MVTYKIVKKEEFFYLKKPRETVVLGREINMKDIRELKRIYSPLSIDEYTRDFIRCN